MRVDIPLNSPLTGARKSEVQADIALDFQVRECVAMRQYKQDVRDKVLEAVASGMSARKAARTHNVGDGSARRWVNAAKRTGRTKPLRKGLHRTSRLAPFEVLIRQEVTSNPHTTVEAILTLAVQAGMEPVSRSTAWAYLKSIGLAVKDGTRLRIVAPVPA